MGTVVGSGIRTALSSAVLVCGAILGKVSRLRFLGTSLQKGWLKLSLLLMSEGSRSDSLLSLTSRCGTQLNR